MSGGGGNEQGLAVRELGHRCRRQLGQPRPVGQQPGGRHRSGRGDDPRDGRIQVRRPDMRVDEHPDRLVAFGDQPAVVQQPGGRQERIEVDLDHLDLLRGEPVGRCPECRRPFRTQPG